METARELTSEKEPAMWCTHSKRPGRLDRKVLRGCAAAGRRRAETHLFSEALERRALMAVNVFDINGTWQRGLSDPGALAGSLSVDTDTGRVSAFNLLRTGGIKENTGTTISTPTGPERRVRPERPS